MNQFQSGIARIKTSYSSLPPSEKKVADYILENTEKTIYLSVSELSNQAEVSDSTIIRFCKNIGFKGYQELKLFLAQDLVTPIENINEDIQLDDQLDTIIQKIAHSNKMAIEETMGTIDLEQLEKAVTILLSAERILFFGVGASGVTAHDAKYKFMRIGKTVDCYRDAHLQAMSASTLSNNDAVVGISHSGSTKDVVDSCRIASDAGAKVICITGHTRSPITQIADIKLITATREKPLSSGALRSKIAQLHTLDMLFSGVAIKQHKKTMDYTEKTAKSVLDKLY
ncbi:MAG: MurR/RpiR family transcriptional regulator [Halanaerobiaceae bacterium]